MKEINNIKIALYFSLYEFQCPCCKSVMLSPDLLTGLNRLRLRINRPIYINSGYRCNKENLKVGGVINSYHRFGMAADIRVKDLFPEDLAIYALSIGFGGIGTYKNFLHLDVRTTKYQWKG